MNINFSFPQKRRTEKATLSHQQGLNQLSRTYVETGDERCPLAGIWLRLNEAAPQTDEPEIAKPTMRRNFPWWAIHAPLINAC